MMRLKKYDWYLEIRRDYRIYSKAVKACSSLQLGLTLGRPEKRLKLWTLYLWWWGRPTSRRQRLRWTRRRCSCPRGPCQGWRWPTCWCTRQCDAPSDRTRSRPVAAWRRPCATRSRSASRPPSRCRRTGASCPGSSFWERWMTQWPERLLAVSRNKQCCAKMFMVQIFFAVVVEGVRWWWWWVGAVRGSATQNCARCRKSGEKKREREKS